MGAIVSVHRFFKACTKCPCTTNNGFRAAKSSPLSFGQLVHLPFVFLSGQRFESALRLRSQRTAWPGKKKCGEVCTLCKTVEDQQGYMCCPCSYSCRMLNSTPAQTYPTLPSLCSNNSSSNAVSVPFRPPPAEWTKRPVQRLFWMKAYVSTSLSLSETKVEG